MGNIIVLVFFMSFYVLSCFSGRLLLQWDLDHSEFRRFHITSILYTQFHATQVKEKALQLCSSSRHSPTPFKELASRSSWVKFYTFCLLVVIFLNSLLSCGTWTDRKIVKGKSNDFKSS